ncbi:MAG: segregation/condensation protein A [Clostridia bacterium]|nr:segregation/condensation protein A [Clostridia bacterium]
MIEQISENLELIKFKLDNGMFEGPIDLLVKMIKDSEINVMDIFIYDITTQFMDYIKKEQLDDESISEYIVFASILVQIKSAKLNPKKYEVPEDDEIYSISDLERDLVTKINEKILNESPQEFEEKEVINVFYPKPVYSEDDYKLILGNLTLEKLTEAFMGILEKTEFQTKEDEVQTIVVDRFTEEDKIKEIEELFKVTNKINFFSLFRSDYTRSEVITVFLSILHIIKKQVANAYQETTDSDIILVRREK